MKYKNNNNKRDKTATHFVKKKKRKNARFQKEILLPIVM
jgi:hypothetical protein